MAKNDHIHTEDNYVAYFSMYRDSNGQRRSMMKHSKINKRNSQKFMTQIPGLRTADVPSG
jgi:hypothetical protein